MPRIFIALLVIASCLLIALRFAVEISTAEELPSTKNSRIEGEQKDLSLLANLPPSGEPPAETKAEAKKRKEKRIFKLGMNRNHSNVKDARWNQMQTGSYMTSALRTRNGIVKRAVSIRVGSRKNAAVSFDTQNLTLRSGWSGGFLEYNAARFGLIHAPRMKGHLQFSAPAGAGWKSKSLHYKGLYLKNVETPSGENSQNKNSYNDRVTLSYDVDEVAILESPWAYETADGQVVYSRSFQVAPHEKELIAIVAVQGTVVSLLSDNKEGDNKNVELVANKNSPVQLHFKPSRTSTTVTVLIEGKPELIVDDPSPKAKTLHEFTLKPVSVVPSDALQSLKKTIPPAGGLKHLTKPGVLRWGSPLKTAGQLGKEQGPYQIDTIQLPYENRFKALMFVGDHDYFSKPGEFALCTVHGDVWILKGVDNDLKEVRWYRFATGLYQPLGLKIIKDQIYVLGRDQITRLHDNNNDGEADYYESFCHDFPTSDGRHDFATCLETDTQGRFYFVNELGLHRVSKDGKTHKIIATGLRNPNGMSVSAKGVVTAAPQEGNWTPASGVFELAEGGHYGYEGPKVTPERPLGYDPPLAWIPRELDNSTGSQVWVESDKFGPIENTLLNLSYGHCQMILMPLEQWEKSIDKNWSLVKAKPVANQLPLPENRHYIQAANVPIPLNFESGIMRGCFSPHDGQLYVSGLRGWTTAAVRDGCFQRVRYTGKPAHFPVKIATLQNGIALTFSSPLEKDSAEDPDSYFVEQWNYWYSSSYGSPEYKISNPKEQGRDPVKVLSATLVDKNTVFLEMEKVELVMSMGIQYNFRAEDKTKIKNKCFHTINQIQNYKMDPAKLVRRKGKGELPEKIVKTLIPGVHWTRNFLNARRTSGKTPSVDKFFHSRIPTLTAAPRKLTKHELDTSDMVTASFYLTSPLKRDVYLGVSGDGVSLDVQFNNEQLFELEQLRDAASPLGKVKLKTQNFSSLKPKLVTLNKGYNKITVTYWNFTEEGANFKLLWGEEESRMESIDPANVFATSNKFHQKSKTHKTGLELFARHQCVRCHQPNDGSNRDNSSKNKKLRPELLIEAPRLNTAGDRLNAEWIAQWLVQPQTVSNDFAMPSLLEKNETEAAADIAAYLTSKENRSDKPVEIKKSKTSSDDLVDFGVKKFEQLGCVTCHRFTPPEEEDKYDRKSLHFVATKFSEKGLARFLKSPHAHYQWNRMPNFRLSNEEVAGLVAFLRDEAEGELPQWTKNKGDAARGKKQFLEKGCTACHQTKNAEWKKINAKFTTKHFRQLQIGQLQKPEAGCLGAEKVKSNFVPQYHLTKQNRSALRAFVEVQSRYGLQSHVEKSQLAEHFMKRLKCASCHDRDGIRSYRPIVMITEGSGKVPDTLPNLTWTGEKLKADWTKRFLHGDIKKPVRNWLPARMPAFPAYAEAIAEGLAAQHGISHPDKTEKEKATLNRELLIAGDIVASKSGLDCRQCHGVGKQMPRGDKGTKIAQGINFEIVQERLRYDFYRRFTLDPTRYDHSSKMPRLAPDGKTTKAKIFDGNARQQFDAAWHYIQYYKKLNAMKN